MNMISKLQANLILAFARIWYEPSFNENEAKNLFTQWAEPINRFILWTVPFIALGALGYTWIKWSAKDEDEKEQRPFMKSAKKILFTAIFVEMGSAIFRIFGLST
ncbi:MAG: hypothetical protein IJH05_04825 [Firmicutes bacterium]|nr:hypothetical protein [Bacillota bacterium]